MVRRRINASAAKVYAAWTQAAQLMHWMHPLDTICLHAEADVRVGGRFRVIMRSPDGEEHDASGTYLEVVPEAKLVFTWAWRSAPERESRVTVVLRADGATTEITLRHERFFDEATRDAHREGWSSALDHLVELFE
ncbi:MAG: SRPBCC domain-containing protein [Paraburkholderia sp.]|nr:SRPBCC domain-containing protein [Paraburkholderia sp.]